jgi:TrmH family RNA methyltransferase
MAESPVHGPDSETIKSLLPNKRGKEGWAYAEGEVLVREALMGTWELGPLVIDGGFLETDAGRRIAQSASARRGRVIAASSKAIAKLSAVDTPPPVGILVRPPSIDVSAFLENTRRVLILDRVSDPGNVGTLIRAGVAFGARVLLTRGTASLSNDKVVRSTAGVCFHENACFAADGASETRALLAGLHFRIAALDANAAVNIREWKCEPKERVAFVVGNESAGIDWTVWSQAERVRIPMLGRVESLNASVSGAIALYELAAKAPDFGGAG